MQAGTAERLKRISHSRSSSREGSSSNFNNVLLRVEPKDSTMLRSKLESMANSLGALKIENSKLRGEKEQLFEINGKYLNNFEKMYESRAEVIHPRVANSQMKTSDDYELVRSKEFSSPRSSQQYLGMNYRGLVRHCQLLHQEVSTYRKLASEFNSLKEALSSTKHTSIHGLVDEINNLSEQNKNLRTSLNRAEFNYLSTKQLYEATLDQTRQFESERDQHKQDIFKLRCKLTRIEEQNSQLQKLNDRQIYSLGVKCNSLEGELRKSQLRAAKIQHLANRSRIEAVQNTHRINRQHQSSSSLTAGKVSPNRSLQQQQNQFTQSRQLYYVRGGTQPQSNHQTKRTSCRITVRKHLSLGP